MQQLIPKIDFKVLRAAVIDNYMMGAGIGKAVCFSCGNAARALAGRGINILEIGPQGQLQSVRWWTPAEIHLLWPDRFDATPGHLPLFLMLHIAMAIRDELGVIQIEGADYPGVGLHVPTGSGETIMCMHLAYPAYKFVAVYDDNHESTRYFAGAPLSGVVGRMFTPIYIVEGAKNSFENWPEEARHG